MVNGRVGACIRLVQDALEETLCKTVNEGNDKEGDSEMAKSDSSTLKI